MMLAPGKKTAQTTSPKRLTRSPRVVTLKWLYLLHSRLTAVTLKTVPPWRVEFDNHFHSRVPDSSESIQRVCSFFSRVFLHCRNHTTWWSDK